MNYQKGTAGDYPEIKDGAIEKWQDKKFGLFIHWGPSAGRNLRHSHSRKSRFKPSGTVPAEVYDAFYKEFNPVDYDPNEWVALAKSAGMRYVIFTAKHHDGFSLFDSKVTDYDIMSSPYGRDVCKQLSQACKKHNLSLGWYYSPRDWYHPNFDTQTHSEYNKFYIAQLRELASNYGEVDILWFDGTGPANKQDWGNTFIKSGRMLRKLQPQILFNPRGGIEGNFETFEKELGYFDLENPWEMCETVTKYGWIYRNKEMPVKKWQNLVKHLIYSIGRNGNYLLNVGPMPNGKIDPNHVEVLKNIGSWMKINSKAVYKTQGGPFIDGLWGASTCRENKIYLFITKDTPETLALPCINAKVISATTLNGNKIDFIQEIDGKIFLKSPYVKANVPAKVVVLQIDKNALDIEPLWVQKSLLLDKKIVDYSNIKQENKSGAGNIIDGNYDSFWKTDESTKTAWVEIDLGDEKKIGSARLTQLAGWNPIKSFRLKYKTEKGKWITFCEGGNPCSEATIQFDCIKARYIRLELTKHAKRAEINDFRLYAPLN